MTLINLLGVKPAANARRFRGLPVIYPEKDANVRSARREARVLLRAHWYAVMAVARELRRRGRLTGARVREIVRAHA